MLEEGERFLCPKETVSHRKELRYTYGEQLTFDLYTDQPRSLDDYVYSLFLRGFFEIFADSPRLI